MIKNKSLKAVAYYEQTLKENYNVRQRGNTLKTWG